MVLVGGWGAGDPPKPEGMVISEFVSDLTDEAEESAERTRPA